MSTKDERIIKFWNDGCSIGRIAAKLGNRQDTRRVRDALIREGIITIEQEAELLDTDTKFDLEY